MNHFGVLLLAFLGACFVFSIRSAFRRRRRGGGGQLPPGPPRLPIIGNIHQLGLHPHKSLAHLAKTYGPLMSLKLGTQLAVIASSPEMAIELLQKHGLAFSNRSVPAAVLVYYYDQFSVTTLPAMSDRWKKLRRIAKEKLFSNHALQAGWGLRRERLQKLADDVRRCSDEGAVMNVGEATFTTMLNLIFTTLFSVEVTTEKEFREHVSAFTRYVGVPNICEFFPVFDPLDPQRLRRRIGYHLGRLLEIVAGMIEQRLQARRESGYQKKNDFLETLLDLIEQNDEFHLSIEEMKIFFVDMIIAGSDSSAATSEWAMVELMLHPDKLAKVREEVKSVVGEKRIVEESDISRLPYLQATIKEVLRYHPAAPLLGPREATEETRVNGYVIPKNAKIIVNFWGITRDPTIWNDPECFDPDRFLDKDIDFEGQHSELIPFGSGRRICPGMPLARRMVHCMVATLCHNFDWKLEKGAESHQLQREDVFGLALQKKTPLRAIPIKI